MYGLLMVELQGVLVVSFVGRFKHVHKTQAMLYHIMRDSADNVIEYIMHDH